MLLLTNPRLGKSGLVPELGVGLGTLVEVDPEGVYEVGWLRRMAAERGEREVVCVPFPEGGVPEGVEGGKCTLAEMDERVRGGEGGGFVARANVVVLGTTLGEMKRMGELCCAEWWVPLFPLSHLTSMLTNPPPQLPPPLRQHPLGHLPILQHHALPRPQPRRSREPRRRDRLPLGFQDHLERQGIYGVIIRDGNTQTQRQWCERGLAVHRGGGRRYSRGGGREAGVLPRDAGGGVAGRRRGGESLCFGG